MIHILSRKNRAIALAALLAIAMVFPFTGARADELVADAPVEALPVVEDTGTLEPVVLETPASEPTQVAMEAEQQASVAIDTVAPEEPWYVAADSGSDKNDCQTVETPCASIGAAVERATAGATIYVASGTYAEFVNLDKQLTLVGANGGSKCVADRGDESSITGAKAGAVAIAADGVVLDGFKVSSPENDLGAGIWMGPDTSGVVLRNNLVTGNQIGIYAGSDGASEIVCNRIDGNNQPGAAGGAGIYAESTVDLAIDRNVITNHTENNPLIFAAVGEDAHRGTMVTNNELDNAYGIYVLSMSGGSFEGNRIATPGATALSIGGGVRKTQISKNMISGGWNGIRVRDDEAGFGISEAIAINRNAITGHGGEDGSGFGVGNLSGYGDAVLDATCNWWGSVSGPGGVATGTGDAVTDGVDYASWLTTDDLDGECNGPLPTSTSTPETGPGRVVRNGRSGGSITPPAAGQSTTTTSTGQVLGAATFAFNTDLWFGMRSDDVRELQARLRALGYFTFPTDTGYFGPYTLAAVKKYQAANGIPTTGYVGPLTRAALNK